MSGRMLMATVAALALAIPAAAQEQTIPLDTERHASPAVEQGAEQAPAMAQELPADEAADHEMVAEEAAPPADMRFIQVQDEAQFLANDEVIGADVHNVMDEEVGRIADLVFDQDQKLVGVVLSVGGFLGFGQKWVAVDVEQIAFPTDDQPARLLVAVTEEQLKNAPDFITRATVEAQRAAEEAQRQAMQEQQQQIPSPTTAVQ